MIHITSTSWGARNAGYRNHLRILLSFFITTCSGIEKGWYILGGLPQLNKKVDLVFMPVNAAEDFLHKLGGAKYFSEIDLSNDTDRYR